MITTDEIIRRATLLGYDVETHNTMKRGSTLVTTISIFKTSATAQPGYEYVRVFQGHRMAALAWIEGEELHHKLQAERQMA